MVHRGGGFFPDILSVIINIKAMLCNNEVNSGKKKETTKQPSLAFFLMQIRVMIYCILLKFVSVFR